MISRLKSKNFSDVHPDSFLLDIRRFFVRMDGLGSRIILLFVLIPLFPLTACGYSSSSLYAYNPDETTFAIPIFENRTKWRELETNLTREVVKQVTSKTPFRITSTNEADYVLRGEITGFSKPVLSEDPLDTVVRSSVKYDVRIKIIDQSTGTIVKNASGSFSASFTGNRQGTPGSAQQEAEEQIGDWVVRQLERDNWS